MPITRMDVCRLRTRTMEPWGWISTCEIPVVACNEGMNIPPGYQGKKPCVYCVTRVFLVPGTWCFSWVFTRIPGGCV